MNLSWRVFEVDFIIFSGRIQWQLRIKYIRKLSNLLSITVFGSQCASGFDMHFISDRFSWLRFSSLLLSMKLTLCFACILVLVDWIRGCWCDLEEAEIVWDVADVPFGSAPEMQMEECSTIDFKHWSNVPVLEKLGTARVMNDLKKWRRAGFMVQVPKRVDFRETVPFHKVDFEKI